MSSTNLSSVPLHLATLCLDCEMITPAQTRCVSCGSVAVMSVARTLNGPRAAHFSCNDGAVARLASNHVASCGNFMGST